MAKNAGVKIEHQRLHGMGEALYKAADDLYDGVTLRAYAPVGGHEDLLPYLVRRLLENGANTSFVHALLDERVPVEKVVTDPIDTVEAHPDRHAKIPTPIEVYGPRRRNSAGLDLSVKADRARLAAAVAAIDAETLSAGPLVGGKLTAGGPPLPVVAPADETKVVGAVSEAQIPQIDEAFKLARAAQPAWDQAGGPARAQTLRAMADALENNIDRLIAILAREAGKTLSDGIAEVREAVDFCRYYAVLAEDQFGAGEVLKGPVGETNTLRLAGRGVFVCISPWNFPLAIFTGQIAAALAAGNAVLAKPAEQTPLIAFEAVKLYHAAGLDPRLLALLPGRGETVGAALTGHEGLDGVAFTGGTDTAWRINQTLAQRQGPIVPFIAETGGLNGMFVDTTAQREQVIDDVIVSAFGSAGQRCSALRLLFLPNDTADHIIDGLKGAMDVLVLGDPAQTVTDVGPVIDAEAKDALDKHQVRLRAEAKVLHALAAPAGGTFFAPVLAEIPAADFLEREVFGPILHVVRYKPENLEQVAGALAARRYGLTLGVHSRIESFAADVQRLVPAGNAYVNRSMTGAVVGVQPFGGEGLSGTGPKAGGPHALLRFAVERAVSVNITAQGGDPALLNL
jgi:RHH-type proline utilization regulon transcriptional repressor/proline dehydrogenase/delta 1-pyrroline-5-carboxylate dehydrogenase